MISTPCVHAGYPLCKDAWAQCMGVGKHRLGRCRHTFQGRDGRTLGGCGGHSDPFRDDPFVVSHVGDIASPYRTCFLNKTLLRFFLCRLLNAFNANCCTQGQLHHWPPSPHPSTISSSTCTGQQQSQCRRGFSVLGLGLGQESLDGTILLACYKHLSTSWTYSEWGLSRQSG